MKRRVFVSFVLCHAAFFYMGCAADESIDEGPVATDEVYPVTIWNRSQFAVEEVTLVDVPVRLDPNDSSVKLAEAMPRVPVWEGGPTPFEVEQAVVVSEFISGSRVAFVRELVSGGESIKVTSEKGFFVDQPGYTVVLFDDSFRLLYPWSEDNPYGAPREQ